MPPPPPEEPPAVPKTELEEVQMKINETTDQSLDSTRRMLNLCEESKEAGIRTLVALDDQGEQLDNIEKGMHGIRQDMIEAEEALKGMEKCCGIFSNPCAKKNSEFKEDASAWKNDDGKVVNSQPQRPVGMDGIPSYGGYVAKYTNDAREDEMENNMEQVSTMVGNLRNMAIDMGSEISNQNQQIDRVNAMAESNVVRIKMANERAHALNK